MQTWGLTKPKFCIRWFDKALPLDGGSLWQGHSRVNSKQAVAEIPFHLI